MGLKVKANFSADRKFPIGIVKAKIKDFRVNKDTFDKIILNKERNFGYQVLFEDEDGNIISEYFWWSKQTIFWIRKLLKAIRLNQIKQPKFSDIIGKTVWLHVAKQYENNDKIDNPENYNPKIIDFTVYFNDESKPIVSENSKHFIVEVHRELNKVELPKPLNKKIKEFNNEGITPNLTKIEDLLNKDEDSNDNEFCF